jgi:hypothetical protein
MRATSLVGPPVRAVWIWPVAACQRSTMLGIEPCARTAAALWGAPRRRLACAAMRATQPPPVPGTQLAGSVGARVLTGVACAIAAFLAGACKGRRRRRRSMGRGASPRRPTGAPQPSTAPGPPPMQIP